MLEQNEINEGIKLCAAAANNERVNKIAIYTHGKGIEIMSGNFQVNRSYYHDENGRKAFFTFICRSEPNGHIDTCIY